MQGEVGWYQLRPGASGTGRHDQVLAGGYLSGWKVLGESLEGGANSSFLFVLCCRRSCAFFFFFFEPLELPYAATRRRGQARSDQNLAQQVLGAVVTVANAAAVLLCAGVPALENLVGAVRVGSDM